MNVDPIHVFERRVGALPCRDAAAAAAQAQQGGLYPERSKSIEKVSLPSDRTRIYVRVA